ncbi:hypothetical protein K504DRAFT_505920 [Pleomassaria siparia CBS 279.74]|uniref:BTB domain-containing protein n=1 Tax=Pleomassaria siparia CBS 279.74 TaxID=1314801 RepID=A0A6G1JZ18_9PLEO|nr:hypothetical protein K504DRAFT_505920 [Pleomassaria siparia CBS 279.74]
MNTRLLPQLPVTNPTKYTIHRYQSIMANSPLGVPPVDVNPVAPICRQRAEEAQRAEAMPLLPSPPTFGFKDGLLDVLDRVNNEFLALGIDFETPQGGREMCRLLSNLTRDGSVEGGQGDEESTVSSSLTRDGYVKGGKGDEESTVSSIDGGQDAVDDLPVYNPYLLGILSTIDARLTRIPTPSVPRMIHAPTTSNPLVQRGGEIWLHCRSAAAQGTIFTMHKAKLSIHSSKFYAYMRANPKQVLFQLDTDELTLQRVVDWIYYPTAVILDEHTTDQLLGMLIVAFTIGIPALHNLIITTLFARHTDPHTPFFPPRSLLGKIYKTSTENDTIRAFCAFLLARAGIEIYQPEVGWAIALALDVEKCMAGRSYWSEMEAADYFAEAGHGAAQKQERKNKKKPIELDETAEEQLDSEVE